MALTPCQVCSCIPGEIPNDTFKQNALVALCAILEAVMSGGVASAVNLTGINGVAPSVNNGATDAGTLRVTISNDSTGVIGFTPAKSATSAVTSVASSASSVTLLASNAARNGAIIQNDSNQILYVKYGATASTASYSVYVQPGSYHEVAFSYTGIIDGIWAAANGSAKVTELTA